jgi:Flp pilus assembly pilin Flp
MMLIVNDTTGTTYVEYLVVVGLLALVAAAGVMALGVPLLRLYRFTELVLTAPV